MTLREAAAQLGVSVKTVRNLVHSRHTRAQFGPPQYQDGPTGPVRVLSADDVVTLTALRQDRRRYLEAAVRGAGCRAPSTPASIAGDAGEATALAPVHTSGRS